MSPAEIERLTGVGAGTPTGELFRRYWLPIACSADLTTDPVKQLQVLGETVVLFRDRRGKLGLVGERCPHRGTAMAFGIPEENGLRCAYHGRLFGHDGRCLAAPNPRHPTPEVGSPKGRIKAYAVQELGGLVFGYFGPQPAPLLPRWEFLLRTGVLRSIARVVVPCNWLQCMENALDEAHVEWLHGHFGNYTLERKGRKDLQYKVPTGRMTSYERFEFGLLQHTVGSEAAPSPIIFPSSNLVGRWLVRVPLDDTHTLALLYFVHAMPEGETAPLQDTVPVYELPLPGLDAQGHPTWSVMDATGADDLLMWYARGPVADRTHERLDPEEDAGIILFRELLEENIARVERGEDPIGIIRDPAQNECIRLPGSDRMARRSGLRQSWRNFASAPERFDPVVAELNGQASRGE